MNCSTKGMHACVRACMHVGEVKKKGKKKKKRSACSPSAWPACLYACALCVRSGLFVHDFYARVCLNACMLVCGGDTYPWGRWEWET